MNLKLPSGGVTHVPMLSLTAIAGRGEGDAPRPSDGGIKGEGRPSPLLGTRVVYCRNRDFPSVMPARTSSTCGIRCRFKSPFRRRTATGPASVLNQTRPSGAG